MPLIASVLFDSADASLHRYDALTLAVVKIWIAMLAVRRETREEAKIIAPYQGIGTVVKLFRIGVGSWI
ncbi:hypothetical protein ASF22_05515 [Methylobacterium sp. Leaf87]|uniref:DUF817 family protein n=1 Tax=Methylobacterium sp. Leaf87 TaxID=1736243 RepID=UPI0006FAB32A|nr:DUF817 family protein [Methylobacterium sp. Leaf87]KQO61926.1 hypothetical protein ASF22_05515 [Methylobacterium sp. Leaf87]